MPQFAANLSFLYQDLPFEARFAAAAQDGFKAVEYLFPYEYPKERVAELLAQAGVRQVLFNTAQGNFAAGERGITCLPDRVSDFRRAVLEQGLPYAKALRCPRLHVMAGLVPPGADRAAYRSTYVENLAWAAKQAAREGVGLCIEPINPRDIPGFFLNRQDEAHAIVADIGASNLQVQMDLYHAQIVEGDLAVKLRKYLPFGQVGHIQIAGVPERNEPDVGELNYGYLLQLIDSLGWEGTVGCEYRPRAGAAGTRAGLAWFQRWKGMQA